MRCEYCTNEVKYHIHYDEDDIHLCDECISKIRGRHTQYLIGKALENKFEDEFSRISKMNDEILGFINKKQSDDSQLKEALKRLSDLEIRTMATFEKFDEIIRGLKGDIYANNRTTTSET